MLTTYEKAVRCGYIVTLKGDIPELKSDKDEIRRILNNICNDIPENIRVINKALHSVLDEIEFIDFWTGIKLYREWY